MDIFLIRHGIAEDRHLFGKDADRKLTDKGRERFTRAVRGLETLGVRFDAVHHSP